MPFHLMWLPLLAVEFSSFGQEAILITVPVRLRMEPAAQASWPADVGVVEMTPGLRLPEPFSVYSADGKAVAFQTLWSAAGERTLIRFDTSDSAKATKIKFDFGHDRLVIHSVPTDNSRRYFLCFGASLPAATGGWNPQARVLIGTRACVWQPANTIAEVSRLLSTAAPIQGRG